MLSASIAAITASWIEATAPEWPRAKAIRSWLASSAAPSRRRRCATALSSKGITVAMGSRIPPPRLISYHRPAKPFRAQDKSGGAFRHRRLRFELDRGLAQRVRHVVEGRVQLVADALHRAN